MASDACLDDMLSSIGYGQWQVPVLVLNILTHLVIPIHMMGSALLGAPVAFRCAPDFSFLQNSSNLSSLSFWPSNLTSTDPTINRSSADLLYDSKCLDPGAPSHKTISLPVTVGSSEVTWRPTELPSCPWVAYDDSVFVSTVITQWDLICEKEMMRPLFQMMYSIGALFGSLIGGQISDSFGRKIAIQVGVVFNVIGVVALYTVPVYSGALVARVLLGGACNFMVLPAFSLALEISSPKYRTVIGMLLGTSFSIAIILMAGLGFFIRIWDHLMILTAGVPLIVLVPLSFYINESPRWLIHHGRGAEAADIMTRAVAENKVALTETLAADIEGLKERSNDDKKELKEEQQHPKKGLSLWLKESCQGASAYCRSGPLRIILFVTPLIWILQGCLYLGIILNANNFTSNDPIIYITMSGVMDISAILLATPLSMRIGRRVLCLCCFFSSGVFLITDLLVPQDLLWLKFTLVMAALMLLAASFQVIFLYTTELFPTGMRSRGFALANLAGNIGFLVAPMITDLLSQIAPWSVSLTFGAGGIAASSLFLLLPETLHRPLPETILDVEKRHRSTRICRMWRKRTTDSLDDASEIEIGESEALNPTEILCTEKPITGDSK
ncbi:organic cation transporter protein-like [Macrobrachium rosenbergii]|uniref:organic cation transporter protein-like n=1 Tax=Macrobrachium rosenbergii TaxID=79674 RepID=UPI0034D71012